MKIYDETEKLIGTGEQSKDNLFYLDNAETSCLSDKNEGVWLWNQKLCHVNFDNMVKISNKKKVRCLPSLSEHDYAMCKQCQMGKMSKSSFKRKHYSSNAILELVHTDLCGSMRTQRYYGEKYFILFVDDLSRIMAIMFLKEKSEAFKMFNGTKKKWKKKW